MGHLVGKDLYRELGRKVDGLTLRAPWNEALHAILKELYSAEEAELLVAMPYGLATLDRIEAVTRLRSAHIERVLEQLCDKGLVFDLPIEGVYHYLPSPMAIGIFELTMMRTGEGLDTARSARLFSEYFETGALWEANAGGRKQLHLMRTLPHEEALADDHVEVLDWERATAIVETLDRFAVGICSCRHEKAHLGTKTCQVPLETCCSMGSATDYLVRRGFARAIDKAEMLDHLAAAREQGLVFNADNVQRKVGFICCCCGCCCNVLLGVSRFGYPHVVVTSSYIARPDLDRCEGCGKCKKACPIAAITLARQPRDGTGAGARPVVDEGICLGCGVCGLRCPSGALKLQPRQHRVLTPETTFERVILQCLEAGTLQNQLFDDPGRITHRFMRAFVGAFLRLPPLKRALLSKALRSRFLAALRAGAGSAAEAVS